MTTPPPYGEPPRLTADAATWRAEDALRDKIAATIREAIRQDGHAEKWMASPVWDGAAIWYADAVLPIVAAEVTAAREQGQNEGVRKALAEVEAWLVPGTSDDLHKIIAGVRARNGSAS